jgi:hypothetical protein
MRLPLLLAVSLAVATPALAAEATPQTLVGTWEVTGVEVADSPVQALVKNDPTYMGAVLEISAEKLIWTKGTDTRPIDPTIDNCDAAPSFTETDGNLYTSCGDAPWGPGDQGGAFHQVSENEITLDWYDGGILTLTRQK